MVRSLWDSLHVLSNRKLYFLEELYIVADKNLFTLCTFWDFDFSSVKRYIVACKNSNIYLVEYGAAF